MTEHFLHRRDLLMKAGQQLIGASIAGPAMAAPLRPTRPDRFQASWESFTSGYVAPDWFRDAKLGLWAHWGPQCEPGASDWYARDMYIQGTRAYEHHLKNYGHPSEVGFMDICHRWKAERWDPAALMKIYRAAGARYFVAMANHHDNFDTYNSRFHAWNATRIGPKKDLIAGWAAAARAEGLKFGISNHTSQAWHWTQVAYGYDPEGPRKGVRYDGFSRRPEDGKGQWWEGLDPRELYSEPVQVAPDGIKTIRDMQEWHRIVTAPWASPMKLNPSFAYRWALRTIDTIDQYDPDLIYFDDAWLPVGQLGLELTARYYNASLARHGKVEVAVTGKGLPPHLRSGIVESVERGFSDDIRPAPWQTCTCIGHWHYDQALFERKGYKSALNVIQRLVDIVSKNGNLLLSVPLPGHGEIDPEALKVVEGIGDWMRVNAEGIHDTRPWRRFGEGPTKRSAGQFNEDAAAPFTSQDIRFTAKKGRLYLFAMAWPDGNTLKVKTLSTLDGKIDSIRVLGTGEPVRFEHTPDGLTLHLPQNRPSATPAFVLRGPIAA